MPICIILSTQSKQLSIIIVFLQLISYSISFVVIMTDDFSRNRSLVLVCIQPCSLLTITKLHDCKKWLYDIDAKEFFYTIAAKSGDFHNVTGSWSVKTCMQTFVYFLGKLLMDNYTLILCIGGVQFEIYNTPMANISFMHWQLIV